MRLVIAGYYGCGNLGDDALLLGLLNGLAGRHEVTVCSGNPEATAAAFKVSAVPRKDIGAVASAIRNADALVFGGGGLLQDTTSLLSLMYYTHLIRVAAKHHKKVALLGQGIGPIRTFIGKRVAARAFSACGLITTRDAASLSLVENLAPRARGAREVADDLAWLAVEPQEAERSRSVAVSARPWKDATPGIVSAFGAFCSRASAEGWQVLPASFDRSMDDPILDVVAPGAPSTLRVDTPQALASGIASVQATVAMRLHAGIFSVAAGILPTLVTYDDKVTQFARSFGSEAIPIERLTGDALWEAFAQSQENLAERQEAVNARREKGLRGARRNIDLLEEYLAGGTPKDGLSV